eukprot:CAMPEP_0194210020 /NCGR_PEP_ID=MMETSP0156-20130528/7948_1 /TAXON_ID=33649 /ORGANISM="Thalassionema nitzschioides, Strain L26-B" /LENGTH=442 /DNA_ID=CAMNT_0038937297 /DNA_START=338 /DNA_END=1667 /DNA_ORIENTATION=-
MANNNSSNIPAADNGDNLYAILGVTSEATDNAIKIAYRKKVLVLHPDKQPPNANHEQVHEAFTRLQNAYEILRDARAEYDAAQEKKKKKRGCSNNHAHASSQTHHRASAPPPPRENQNRYYSNTSSRQERYDWSDYTKYYSSETHPSGAHKARYQKENPDTGSNEWSSQQNQSYKYSSSSEKQNRQGQHNTNQHSQSYNSTSSSERQNSQRQKSSNGFYPKTTPGQRSAQGSAYNSHNQETNSKEKTNKSNHSQHQSSTNRDRDKKEKPKAQKKSTFGVTTNGAFCKRCIQQGQYCWQHEKQNKGESHAKKNHSAKPSPTGAAGESSRIWGVTSDGKPCQRCFKEGGYCWQHEWQNEQCHPTKVKSSQSNVKPHPTGTSSVRKSARIWGVTAMEQPARGVHVKKDIVGSIKDKTLGTTPLQKAKKGMEQNVRRLDIRMPIMG